MKGIRQDGNHTTTYPHLFEEKYFRMISKIGDFIFAQIGLYYFALAGQLIKITLQ
jgi:hypothetical protein